MAVEEAPRLNLSVPIPIEEVVALLRYASENSSAVPAPDNAPNLSARFLEEAMRLADDSAGRSASGGVREENGQAQDTSTTQRAPTTPEALALAAYRRLREQQDDQATLVPKLYRSVVAYEAASDQAKPEAYAEVLDLYTRLTRLTAPVTGRTILDTPEVPRRLRLLYLGTGFLVFSGLALQSVEIWLVGGVARDPEWLYWLSTHTSIITHFTPFVWGAIGACVFLLKYLHDIAQIQAFDLARLKGITTRVALGSILGGIAVQLFDTASVGNDGLALKRDVFAFLAGLGVRVVYGAMERVIQLISDKLNVESVRTTQMKSRPELKEAA